MDLTSVAQLDARLILVLHEVIVVGLAVLGCDFDSLFLRGDHLVSDIAVYHIFTRTATGKFLTKMGG